MKPIYRFFFIIAFSMLPLGSLLAQPIVVRDLMPLSLGQYVEYNEYDTLSSGVANRYSSYTVLQSGMTYMDSSGVSDVLDTSGQDAGDTAVITQLHYRFDDARNLQVFADAALMTQVLGPKLAPGATPPNVWITELKTSAGTGVEYTIDTMNTTYKGAAFRIVFTGTYQGPKQIVVSGVNYSNAQQFDLTGHVTVSVFKSVVDQFSTTQSEWLVTGIGIVKTNFPRTFVSIGGGLISDTSGGTEKEMIAHGVASSSVSQSPSMPSSGIRFYPNPASDNLTLLTTQPASRIFLYDATGRMVRSFDLVTHTGEALLWVKDLPNGMYLARVQYTNGTSGSKKILIQH